MATEATWLDERRILVVVGPGGVGKTTTAAALALEAARRGRHVLVLTVDPARRLMDSLGLSGDASRPVRVPPAAFAEAGISLGAGSLSAMMLDVRETFDAVVERHAPSEAVRRRIMENPFYGETTTSMAGSQECMAMEALFELDAEDEYELIVLDTPPTAHALDFIAAPERLTAFFEGGPFKFMLTSMARASRMGLGLLRFDNALVEVMNRFVGAETFMRLVDFVAAFQEMYDGFEARARKVSAMLRSPETGFAVVTSTRSVAMGEGLFLYERLREMGMGVEAFVANRVIEGGPEAVDEAALQKRLIEAGVGKALSGAVARGAHQAVERARSDAEVDRQRLQAIARSLSPGGPPLIVVPRFERDVHDLANLAEFAAHVVGA
jgi:anion-transporting  ArsA/GET3 family ATPase